MKIYVFWCQIEAIFQFAPPCTRTPSNGHFWWNETFTAVRFTPIFVHTTVFCITHTVHKIEFRSSFSEIIHRPLGFRTIRWSFFSLILKYLSMKMKKYQDPQLENPSNLIYPILWRQITGLFFLGTRIGFDQFYDSTFMVILDCWHTSVIGSSYTPWALQIKIFKIVSNLRI